MATTLGVVGSVLVLAIATWIASRARGLRRYRVDLHLYRHDDDQDDDE